MSTTRSLAAAAAILAALCVGVGVEHRVQAADGAAAPSVVVPVTPFRILDTRQGIGTSGLVGKVGPGATITLSVAGVGSVPSDATGVVLNLTASGASSTGWITAWPTGRTRPEASVLNLTPGQDLPNMITASLGDGGKLDLYNFTGNVDLIADVAAYLVPAGTTGPGPGSADAYSGHSTKGGTIYGPEGQVARLSLPAGSYVVTARITISTNAVYSLGCRLSVGSNVEEARFDERVATQYGASYEFSVTGTLSAPRNVPLLCSHSSPGADLTWDEVSMSAVHVSTLTTQNITP